MALCFLQREKCPILRAYEGAFLYMDCKVHAETLLLRDYLSFELTMLTMDVEFTTHALERMRKYDVDKAMVEKTLEAPDSVTKGHTERRVYQKRLNGHVLRVIVEEHKSFLVVITTYKARSVRYDI